MDLDLTKNYESFAKFKEENANGVIELPKGNYEIDGAFSTGEFAEKMYDPYYGRCRKGRDNA